MEKTHPFQPVYNKESEILILGSMPSLVSVKNGFYYMHPQNRFWKVLSKLYKEDAYSMSIEEKKSFLYRHHIALYDIVLSCVIDQSKDASIDQVVCTDILGLIQEFPIRKILLNGSKAYSIFCKSYPILEKIAVCMPSTSSANAKMSLESLCVVWQEALLDGNNLI